MSKNKLEKVASIDEKMKQLENQRKKILQQHKAQERKDRTKRLCKRMGLFESMLPDTVPLTDEQFKTFLEKTAGNDYGRRTLANIAAQNAATAAPKAAQEAVHDNPTPDDKPTETAQESGTRASASVGKNAKASS